MHMYVSVDKLLVVYNKHVMSYYGTRHTTVNYWN